jgi:hypothetical protein
MSTRSTTHFISGEHTAAIIYRHSDGYPEGHGKDLDRFFDDVEAQTSDRRYTDPSYLAAKLVVWLAREFALSFDAERGFVSHADTRPLDFISVGIVDSDPADIEYRYTIDCGQLNDNGAGRPTVTCYEVNGQWDDDVETTYEPVPIPQ